MDGWTETLDAARRLVTGRDAVRLANLAIAAQADARVRPPQTALTGADLVTRTQELALDDLPAALDEAAWSALSEAATIASTDIDSRAGMDRWVQAFQGTDPARKSRGAYATPYALARPMAKLLLHRCPDAQRIVDPSAGAGGLLIAVLDELAQLDGSPYLHVERLHGVELDPVARELACLLIWLAAGSTQVSLAGIAERVVVDNAITRDWSADEPYDALVMNPPWDSLRGAAAASSEVAADRSATGIRLAKPLPAVADDLPPLFSMQGRGDRNLYKAFVELAPHLVRPEGRIVALIPGAWSSDLGTKDLRRLYLERLTIEQWTSFENRKKYFPIDNRYKFGVLAARRSASTTEQLRTRAFAADVGDLDREHVNVTHEQLMLIGGPANGIPDITSRSEVETLARYKQRTKEFFDPTGPFGTIVYEREVDMTEGRKRRQFARLEDVDATLVAPGAWQGKDNRRLVPLIEGRMVGQFECFAKSWVSGSGRSAAWTYTDGRPLRECRPQFLIERRETAPHRVALCDVTSATNTRTVMATIVPDGWACGNTAPVLRFRSARDAFAATAVLNSMVFDWQARRMMAGLHLNKFYLESMVWPRLSDADLDELAAAAVSLHARSPRFAELGLSLGYTAGAWPLDFVATHVLIERVTARGFGLTSTQLRVILDGDLTHRRGFWRHFAADPHAFAIATTLVPPVPTQMRLGLC